MNTFEALLQEATSFRHRLTEDEHISSAERALRTSISPFSIADSDPFSSISSGPGIYYIEAQFPFKTEAELEMFGKSWGMVRAKDLAKSVPRYHPNRAKHHVASVAAGSFIPLYLGKEWNIQSRLRGHLDGQKESSTYSMKLRDRSYLLRDVNLRVGTFPMPATKEAYFCVALVEAALRKRLHPILGRQ